MSRVVLLFALSLRLSLPVTFALSIPVAAQQPQPQKPKPTSQADEDQDSVIRVTTNLVQLDVVVTKDGKAVTDLTSNDFVITEDGRAQTITHFSYVSNVPNENSEKPVAKSTSSAAAQNCICGPFFLTSTACGSAG